MTREIRIGNMITELHNVLKAYYSNNTERKRAIANIVRRIYEAGENEANGNMREIPNSKQKSNWGEEDKKIINKIGVAVAIHYSCDTAVKVENWLKSRVKYN